MSQTCCARCGREDKEFECFSHSGLCRDCFLVVDKYAKDEARIHCGCEENWIVDFAKKLAQHVYDDSFRHAEEKLLLAHDAELNVAAQEAVRDSCSGVCRESCFGPCERYHEAYKRAAEALLMKMEPITRENVQESMEEGDVFNNFYEGLKQKMFDDTYANAFEKAVKEKAV